MTTKYDCPDMMDLLVEYLEGDLTDDQRAHLEGHLNGCPPCMNYLETYKKTGDLCRSVMEKEMPGELKSRLRSFLKKECGCGSPASDD